MSILSINTSNNVDGVTIHRRHVNKLRNKLIYLTPQLTDQWQSWNTNQTLEQQADHIETTTCNITYLPKVLQRFPENNQERGPICPQKMNGPSWGTKKGKPKNTSCFHFLRYPSSQTLRWWDSPLDLVGTIQKKAMAKHMLGRQVIFEACIKIPRK